MTETEENKLMVEAEIRRREKAAKILSPAVSVPADALAASLSRLQTLASKPIARTTSDDSAEKAAKIIADAGIPKRHKQEFVTPEGHPWLSTRAHIANRLGSGFMLALVGIQGTGKTQMGAAIIQDAAAKSRASKFASAMGFFIDLKSTFRDDAESREGAIIARYAKPKLLVLDEMDERSQSDWENRLLFHMLNERYNAMLDTLLISRRSKAEFLQSVGVSIQSRLQETGGVIECAWPSFRGKG